MEFENERYDIKKTLRLKLYSIGCSKALLIGQHSILHSTVMSYTIRVRVSVFRHFQQYFNYILVSHIYWWRKPKYPEKTTDLPNVTDKLSHMMLYRVHSSGRDSNSQR
jgi:hypothetical protein